MVKLLINKLSLLWAMQALKVKKWQLFDTTSNYQLKNLAKAPGFTLSLLQERQ